MIHQSKVKLLGEYDEDSDWIPSAEKKWVPPVNKFKKWGTNLPHPRKQWKENSNNRKGGNK